MNLFQVLSHMSSSSDSSLCVIPSPGDQTLGSPALTVSHLLFMSTKEVDFITSLSQIRKLRFREVKYLM